MTSLLARRWYVSEDGSTQLQNSLEIRIQAANRFLLDRITLDAMRISETEQMRINRVSTCEINVPDSS